MNLCMCYVCCVYAYVGTGKLVCFCSMCVCGVYNTQKKHQKHCDLYVVGLAVAVVVWTYEDSLAHLCVQAGFCGRTRGVSATFLRGLYRL